MCEVAARIDSCKGGSWPGIREKKYLGSATTTTTITTIWCKEQQQQQQPDRIKLNMREEAEPNEITTLERVVTRVSTLIQIDKRTTDVVTQVTDFLQIESDWFGINNVGYGINIMMCWVIGV